MRFFFRKKDNSYPSKRFIITPSKRDHSGFEENDAYIKFWIPESIEKLIDEVTGLLDTSMSDFVRQVLFLHLYGRHDLLAHYESQSGLYSREDYSFVPDDLHPDYKGKAQKPPLEKKIADGKVWLPSKMKRDLRMMAEQEKMKLSVYVRQVLQTHLLGVMPCEPGLSDQLPPNGYEEE